MSSDEESFSEVNPLAHKKLLSEINDIVKFQHIKKPVRNEPSVKNSEFHLVKSKSLTEDNEEESKKTSKKSVSISSIAQTVQKNTKQKEVAKQLKNAFKHKNVLVKPLEKVHADRIQRTIAYDNTKAKLARWDAVVTKNQHADQLVFPLDFEKSKFKSKTDHDVTQFRFKTQIMKDIEEIHNECFPKPSEPEYDDTQTEMLTLEEMQQRRKELNRLKLKESQKIAKKRMQGKIKSKKYHKLKKREELKKKMKEFEELKAANPEAALKELEKIEKQRVQERTTLRHKNTGTWAKNLKVRAKYDENVKQDLEVQLALGRELTQKQQNIESSDSEDEEMVTITNENENPWLGGEKSSADPLDEIFSGYKKFWDEYNSNVKQVKKIKESYKEKDEKVESDDEEKEVSEKEDEDVESEASETEDEDKETEDEENSSEEDPSSFINDLFDEAEEKVTKNMDEKLKNLKPKLLENEKKGKKMKKKRKVNAKDSSYLQFEKKARLGDIDEGLIEGDIDNDDNNEKGTARARSKQLLKEVKKMKEKKAKLFEEINPDSFLNVKSKHLITALPKSQDFDDIDEDDDVKELTKANKMSLVEAFANDDIVNDFEQEVEDEEKKRLGNEDLGLPGWGNWAGHGVKEKKKRFEKKLPDIKKKPRIIINTNPNEKLQKHLISSIPFPFKSIQDFEMSMRLPIGRDFIPETAHRKLTMPSVVTKAGTVIEPMSEEILVKNQEIKNKFIKRNKRKGKKLRK
ncbi:CLUMA_CG005409, isoform A [Clunio marinus]|uniref:CLUMA_CG005409, isoform A n=1 Tax=Clunio marinus TaxID=568069 RepID=A0A1J1I067_9DIPT|nr:CLUMA_CG005409, isoform A [Clunio marinus]